MYSHILGLAIPDLFLFKEVEVKVKITKIYHSGRNLCC
jgi:hypothetical protein